MELTTKFHKLHSDIYEYDPPLSADLQADETGGLRLALTNGDEHRPQNTLCEWT